MPPVARLVAPLLLVVLGGSGCRGPAAERAAAPAPSAGATVYAQACARCHGPAGAGDGPLAARLGYVPDLRTPRDPARVAAVVREGRGAMPGHADRLSPEHIAAVVAFVAELGARGR